jgi:hypothetical protein
MVHQEDVMKVGHHFQGLDLADADVLRCMMSGKYRNKNPARNGFCSQCINPITAIGYLLQHLHLWTNMNGCILNAAIHISD